MKKVFIFTICGECNEPVRIISPCDSLGYNKFPTTNFHGELSVEDTEKLRNDLIKYLKEDGNNDEANFIEKNTRVIEVEFLNFKKV